MEPLWSPAGATGGKSETPKGSPSSADTLKPNLDLQAVDPS